MELANNHQLRSDRNNQRLTIGTKKATILQLMVVAKSMRMPSIERVVERVVEDSCLVVSWGEVIMKIRA